MAGLALFSARKYQWGKEATRGTAVAATSQIAVSEIQFDPSDLVHRPRLAKGLLIRNPGNEVVVNRGTGLIVAETELAYDQIQNFLSSLQGGRTGVGAGADKTWTFAPSLTADPAPDAWTIERRLSDGTDSIDNEWAYCLWSEIEILYQIDRPLMFRATGFGRRVQASTLTAAQALPTIENPPTPLSQVWIDSTWAALGTTAVAGQVLRARITVHTGLKPKLTLDSRADLDFTTYVFDAQERFVELEATLMVKASAGQFATEKTAAEAQTLRAMRFKVLGTTSRELTLDMLLKHEKGSVQMLGQEDGQDTFDVRLVSSTDNTNWLSAKVVNAVAAYV